MVGPHALDIAAGCARVTHILPQVIPAEHSLYKTKHDCVAPNRGMPAAHVAVAELPEDFYAYDLSRER